MGIATVPDRLPADRAHARLGVLAPFLLVVMRFCQGLGLGGEWSGAALLATENAPTGKRAIYGTFPQLGAPIGFIVANVLFLVLALHDDATRRSPRGAGASRSSPAPCS